MVQELAISGAVAAPNPKFSEDHVFLLYRFIAGSYEQPTV